MWNEKRIKTLVIASLLITETFVWTASGSIDSQSLGIIGGSDGPTSIDIRNSGEKPELPDLEDPAGGQADGDLSGTGEDADNQPQEDKHHEKELQEAESKGLLLLVNKKQPISPDYKPEDLQEIRDFVPDRSPETRYMRAEAADAFHNLVEQAAQDGIVIKMTTAYRSYGFQKLLFDSYVEKEGEEMANTFSAKPGQSEHQTGLAVDVSSPSVDYQLSDDYGKTAEGKWVAANAYRFGFILRFPEGKEDITGYQYEPWHLRYVGTFAAKEIHDQDLTLEEYLDKYNVKE
jgi:D-alanyl-D-alanine carboxypeptidase